MGKVVVTMFMTLDGVMEAPEKWSFPYWDDAISDFKTDEVMATSAHLLGRNTYESFASAWPSRTGEFADQMNNLPKYVVSTTFDHAEWNNSTVIKANVVEEIRKLKQQYDGDILVAGSATLVQTLMKHDLADEYRILIYPLVLGTGKRLFQEGSSTTLKLVESKAFKSGVALHIYQPEQKA